ncbi:response regulator [Halobacteriales archaeon QS_1_67_19]|nr:MAG: response regulator [Halobacteriales archaeon QS_1_67_19]
MTRSVIIAEDDAEIRQLLRFKLESSGFDVTTFEDGRACIEHFETREQPPEIVVLDVMMPQADGFQVLDHVRDDDVLSDVPVLMLTARSREDDVVEGFDRGATDYVTKPFSPSEVVARIERLVESQS